MSAPTSSRRRIGWSEQVFEEIVSRFVSRATGDKIVLYDISSPPGTGKTFTVLRFIAKNRKPSIVSFPTHQNQELALKYLVELLSRELGGRKKLPLFILDYAGLENYCLFHRIDLVQRMLDKFRNPGETYVDAVQKLLGTDLFFIILSTFETFEYAEEIYMKIAEMLDAGESKESMRREVEQIVRKRGQYEICLGVCPVGLFARFHRRSIYDALSKPKIITWRKHIAEKLKDTAVVKKKLLTLANSEQFVDNIEKIIQGEVDVEWLLCPRLLLIMKCSLLKTKSNPRGTPVYLSVRRTVYLTPHAGLEFVSNTVRKQLEVSKTSRRYLLYVDEYDAYVKPRRYRVFSLNEAKTIVAVADAVASSDEYRGIEVDEYLRRYAMYVKEVLSKIVDIVEKAVEEKTYHPYVSLFIEGALSEFMEKKIQTKTEVKYLPLGARISHIKYFLENEDDRELFRLVLNPKPYFEDLIMEDPEWFLRLREAEVVFKTIVSTTKCIAERIVKRRKRGRVYVETMTESRNTRDVLGEIREFTRDLLFAPRLVYYYVLEGNDLYLESIDARLIPFILFSDYTILTSATPIAWNLLVSGTNTGITSSDYESIVKNISFSFSKFSTPVHEVYDAYEVRKYQGFMPRYGEEYVKRIHEYVASGANIDYSSNMVSTREIEINQVSPLTTMVKEYRGMMTIHPVSVFKPIGDVVRKAENRGEYIDVLRESLKPYLMLIVKTSFSTGRNILVLAQNKTLARYLSSMLKLTKCHGSICGEDVGKISHYVSRNKKIVLTWFRSRIGRGVEIDVDTSVVLVVGSPYPEPRVLVNYASPETVENTAALTTYCVRTMNSGAEYLVYKCLTPRDYLNGLAELYQSIGRSLRSSLRTGKNVHIFIPWFIYTRVKQLAPSWIRA